MDGRKGAPTPHPPASEQPARLLLPGPTLLTDPRAGRLQLLFPRREETRGAEPQGHPTARRRAAPHLPRRPAPAAPPSWDRALRGVLAWGPVSACTCGPGDSAPAGALVGGTLAPLPSLLLPQGPCRPRQPTAHLDAGRSGRSRAWSQVPGPGDRVWWGPGQNVPRLGQAVGAGRSAGHSSESSLSPRTPRHARLGQARPRRWGGRSLAWAASVGGVLSASPASSAPGSGRTFTSQSAQSSPALEIWPAPPAPLPKARSRSPRAPVSAPPPGPWIRLLLRPRRPRTHPGLAFPCARSQRIP